MQESQNVKKSLGGNTLELEQQDEQQKMITPWLNRNWLLIGAMLIIGLAYANSLTGEFHFDDQVNIVNNEQVHLEEITFQAIKKVLSRAPDPSIPFRPVSAFTFAVNWYLSPGNVFIFHLTNLLLHLGVFVVLYHIILQLQRLEQFSHLSSHQSRMIALGAAILWALNPIQTQAVTYIVQRMAVLVALFSALGMLSYIKFRMNPKEWLHLGWAVLCFFLALGAKENGLLFPVSLLLVELLFFQSSKVMRLDTRLVAAGLILGAACCLLFVYYNPATLPWLDYSARSFTLHERVLTEFRVVVHYLSLIFYPSPDRLALLHDVELSQSLFSPLTTLWAVLFIVALLGSAVMRVTKSPVYSFAVLYFFLNHLVESTVVPLEIVFEHRNYLPSLFLFWPLALFVGSKVSLHAPRLQRGGVYAVFIVIILCFAYWTQSRNVVWQTERSLCMDTHQKAPGQARPAYCLGNLAADEGDYLGAIDFFEKSLNLNAPTPAVFKPFALLNLADIHLTLSNYEEAERSYTAALEYQPDSSLLRYKLAQLFYLKKDFARSQEYIDKLVAAHKDGSQTHWLQGKIYLVTGKVEPAITEFVRSLELDKNNIKAANDMALGLLISGEKESALELAKNLKAERLENCTTLLVEILLLDDNPDNSLTMSGPRLENLYAQCSRSLIAASVRELMESGIDENSYSLLNRVVEYGTPPNIEIEELRDGKNR